jgi:hypothetical protein
MSREVRAPGRIFRIRGVLFCALVLLAGCASHQQPAPAPVLTVTRQSRLGTSTSPPLESQSMDLRQWLMAAEFSFAIAAGDAQHPIWPDDLLIAAFRQHRSTFEELRQMILADSRLRRVDEDWTDPRDPTTIGVSPERIATYRRLFSEVGCGRGFGADPTGGIDFISGSSGLVVAGASKGYCYLESPPSLTVTNTATYRPPHATEDYKVFRPIEGHWYLYFSSW